MQSERCTIMTPSPFQNVPITVNSFIHIHTEELFHKVSNDSDGFKNKKKLVIPDFATSSRF